MKLSSSDILKKAALSVCAGAFMLSASSAFAADAKVLPIDKAKFVTGQKFDFLVEVTDHESADLKVLINGQPAEKFFAKEASVTADKKLMSYKISDVFFSKAGSFDISVEYQDGGKSAKKNVKYVSTSEKAPKTAKNVILVIGDGMSLPAKQTARIMSKGITEGRYNDILEMEKLSKLALVTTSGYDSLVTDSANSASAYATGHKGVNNAMGTYTDSTPSPFDDPKVENIIELVKRTKGMSTGIVSTSNITDATPAAMLAHTRKRSEQNFIAKSMLDPIHRPDVILGGGSRHFIPMSVNGSKRTDNENVVEEFKKQGYAFSGTRSELLATPKNADKLLGLYNMDNMDVYIDRAMLKNPKVLRGFDDQPGLVEMTQKALDTLSKNPNGFFLMVEGACVDKQLHTMDWQRAAYDNIELDQAVGVIRKFAEKNPDTLIIVVPDHSHGASITGTYHEKDGKTGREAVRTYGNAIFPTFEDKDGDGFPDSPSPDVTLAIHFANHPDYNENYRFKEVPTSPAIMADGKAIANPAVEGEFYKGNLPSSDVSEVHSADDVLLMADGPGSEYFGGVIDNTEVFFGMVRALGIDALKSKK